MHKNYLTVHRKCAPSPVQFLLVKAFTILNGLTSRMSKGFIVLVLIIWKLLFLTRVMAGILTWQFLLDFKTSCVSDEMRECLRSPAFVYSNIMALLV